MQLFQKVKIKNALGLHARPATAIVKLLQNKKSSCFFTYRKETINARSIMSILMLAARKNSQIAIAIEGVDAEETMHELMDAFENHFGEKKNGR